MKATIFLLSVLLALNANAQRIINKLGYEGLNYRSGQPALPVKYDQIKNADRHLEDSPIFIYSLDGQYGIFNMTDSSSTGCIYDSVYTDWNEHVYFEKNGKKGFLGYSQGKYVIVEPRFDDVLNVFEAPPVEGMPTIWCVSVADDSLWGAVSYADGSVILPAKYPNPVSRFQNGLLFTSVDQVNNTQILVHPQTLAEFHMGFPAHVMLYEEWNLLVATDRYNSPQNTLITRAWRYDTGIETWYNESHASSVKAEVLSAEIILLREEFQPLDKDQKKTVTFYNLSNRAMLFTFTGGPQHRVEIRHETSPARFEIYVTDINKSKTAKTGCVYE